MTRPGPQIHTYHCLCASLLLASTHKLSTLPRRAPPALDNAVILPLPSAPRGDANETSGEDIATQISELGYSVLVGMNRDVKAAIVRREDGFEKRHPWRCARCNLMIGYELDEEHLTSEDDNTSNEKGKGKAVEKLKVLYLLPGGVVSTDVMASGKKISESQVGLGESGMTVAAFES